MSSAVRFACASH